MCYKFKINDNLKNIKLINDFYINKLDNLYFCVRKFINNRRKT